MKDQATEGFRSVQRTSPVRSNIQARAKLPQTRMVHETSGLKIKNTPRVPVLSMPRRGKTAKKAIVRTKPAMKTDLTTDAKQPLLANTVAMNRKDRLIRR